MHLTNVDVNYTPEGQWMAYENGMPISVMMTLRFNELEPIYDTDYSEKFNRVDNMILMIQMESIGDLFQSVL